MCRVVPLRVGFLRVGFLRVGFRVGFFSRLGVAAAPVAGVLSGFFFPGVSETSVSVYFYFYFCFSIFICFSVFGRSQEECTR